jgi:hypothetical protein
MTTKNNLFRFVFFVTFVVMSAVASAQGRTGLGAPCAPGQYSHSGLLLVCSDAGTFRYALHEDVPPTPEGGYAERPSWYPALASIFRANNAPACPLSGRVTFTSPVIRPEDLIVTVPQGMVASEHVTPIDHGYIGVKGLGKPRASRTEDDYVRITAPADAEVIEVSSLGSPTSMRVVLAHGCDTYSIYMVINRLTGALAHLQDDVQRGGRPQLGGLRILAGEEFGIQRDNPLDFSVHDGASWLPGFLAPFAYTSSDSWKPYTVNPWPYFTPELAELYESKMQRVAAPRWGVIDQDVVHTAAGNWFLDGTVGYSGRTVDTVRSATSPLMGGPIPGKNSPAWSHLAFLRHWVQPSRWVMSIGWWRNEAGDALALLIDAVPGQPDPSQLSASSGVVVYRLRTWFSSGQNNDSPAPIGYDLLPGPVVLGLVAVQVNADDSVTVEPMPGTQDPAAFAGFTAARRIYRR